MLTSNIRFCFFPKEVDRLHELELEKGRDIISNTSRMVQEEKKTKKQCLVKFTIRVYKQTMEHISMT